MQEGDENIKRFSLLHSSYKPSKGKERKQTRKGINHSQTQHIEDLFLILVLYTNFHAYFIMIKSSSFLTGALEHI